MEKPGVYRTETSDIQTMRKSKTLEHIENINNVRNGSCIILAAGSGDRLGPKIRPKHLTKIYGAESIIWSLKTAIESNAFREIYITVGCKFLENTKQIVNQFFNVASNNIHFIEGAPYREGSLKNAYEFLVRRDNVKASDLITLMDANRPFTPIRQLHSIINEAEIHGCACPGRGVINGIAEISEGYIVNVPDKVKFIEFVTPEVIKKNILDKTIDSEKLGISGFVERAITVGIQPKFICATELNTKLTYPEDITYLEGLAQKYNLKPPQRIIS